MKWHRRATLRRFSHRLGPCEVEETVIMLFSGAAISLAARGHWVSERGRPALLPVCPPARLSLPTHPHAYLSFCMAARVFLRLSDYLLASFPRLHATPCVPTRVCMWEDGRTPRDQEALLSDTARQIMGGCGRLLGLVLSPSAAQLLLLLVVKPKYHSSSSSPPAYYYYLFIFLSGAD